MTNLGFNIYLLFTCSWFLHLTARINILGAIRFDLILISILTVITIISENNKNNYNDNVSKYLKYLIIYVALSIPFVEWPGSVIRYGFENLIKAVVFYYFSVLFINTRDKLVTFMAIFIGCQFFRVLEPVYLHLTQGYWGSTASMANWEFMNRLSGAPKDVINPNGLAAIILNIIPFFYYFSGINKINLLISICSLPVCLYALALTGSRSGIVGMIVVMMAIVAKSRNKILLIISFILVCAIGFSLLALNMKDRYISLVDSSTKNSGTIEGRIEGVTRDFKVAMRKPFFGHGLGTSREANANFGLTDQPSHNLYTEILQELGVFGLVIFLSFMASVIISHKKNMVYFSENPIEDKFMKSMNLSMYVWFLMNIIFSFASYGLSGYEWYFFSGLSVIIRNVASHA